MAEDRTGYRRMARLLHWGVAVLVLMMIPAGLTMTRPGLDRSLQDALFVFHKNTGVLLLAIILIRLAYRLRHPPPPLPEDIPRWQRLAAAWSHRALYAVLIAMPVSGYVRVRAGGFPIEGLDRMGIGTLLPRSDPLAEAAKSLHAALASLLVLLLLIHMGAALHHALIRRDGVWARIWPPFGGAGPSR